KALEGSNAIQELVPFYVSFWTANDDIKVDKPSVLPLSIPPQTSSPSKGPYNLHHSQVQPIPKTWKQMQKHPLREHYMEACHKEMKEIQERQTWTIISEVTPKIQRDAMPLKWVFDNKLNAD